MNMTCCVYFLITLFTLFHGAFGQSVDHTVCGKRQKHEKKTDFIFKDPHTRNPPGSWPWVVSMGEKSFLSPSKIWTHRCGGALVTPEFVLTAAHCALDLDREIRNGDIFIRAGDGHLQDVKDDANVEEVEAVDYSVHPNYKRGARYSDIAVLRLARPVSLSSTIRTVCLPTEATSREEDDNLPLTVTGWGADVQDQSGKSLYDTIVQVYSEASCNITHDGERRSDVAVPIGFSSDLLCGGDPAGSEGVCHGDSGSPAVFFKDVERSYVLKAIVSGGLTCGTQLHPNIYVRISDSTILSWIYHQLNMVLPVNVTPLLTSPSPVQEQTKNEDYYFLQSAAYPDKFLTAGRKGGRVTAQDNYGGQNQKWTFKNGYLVNKKDGLVLDVNDLNKKQPIMWTLDNSGKYNVSKFEFVADYTIRSAPEGTLLEVSSDEVLMAELGKNLDICKREGVLHNRLFGSSSICQKWLQIEVNRFTIDTNKYSDISAGNCQSPIGGEVLTKHSLYHLDSSSMFLDLCYQKCRAISLATGCQWEVSSGYCHYFTSQVQEGNGSGNSFCFAFDKSFIMYATCDNNMKVFADGNLLATNIDWSISTAVNIPAETRIIQIDCEDVGDIAGILASSSTNLKTDNTWTCSSDNGVTYSPAYEIQGNDGWGVEYGHPATPIDGISTHAKWIWTSGGSWRGKHRNVSCKIDLGSSEERCNDGQTCKPRKECPEINSEFERYKALNKNSPERPGLRIKLKSLVCNAKPNKFCCPDN